MSAIGSHMQILNETRRELGSLSVALKTQDRQAINEARRKLEPLLVTLEKQVEENQPAMIEECMKEILFSKEHRLPCA